MNPKWSLLDAYRRVRRRRLSGLARTPGENRSQNLGQARASVTNGRQQLQHRVP